MADLSNLGVKIPIFPEPKDMHEKEVFYAIRTAIESIQDAINKANADVDDLNPIPLKATKAEAEAASDVAKYSNPLRVKEYLDTQAPDRSDNQYYSSKATCTTTLDWDDGNVQYIVLANGSQTFTFSNPKDGGRYVLILKQPSSGSAGTVTFPASVLWSNGNTVVLSTTNSKVDVISFVYDGTNSKYYAGCTLNF